MKRIIIKLPRHVKRRIKHRMKRDRDSEFRDRCRIILLYQEGYGCNTISKITGRVPATVIRVARRFQRFGEEALEDGRKENGIPKVDADLLEALIEILGKSPQDYGYLRTTWTQELIAIVLAQITRVEISNRTVGRILKILNVRWGRPRPVVYSPMPKAAKTRRIRKIQKMLRDLPKGEIAFYVDEVDIHLNPRIGPDYMFPGVQKEVVTPGINKKQYIAGALNAKTGEIIWVTGIRKNSDLFIDLMIKLRRLHPKAKRIHLILDNYSIHSSKKTNRIIEQLGGVVVCHFLPPYSPNYNLIERLWKQLHDNVTRNHKCRTIEALMKNVDLFLKRASPFPGSKPSIAKMRGSKVTRCDKIIRRAS